MKNPIAADARGLSVMKYRFIYSVLGGILIGIGGATFSLEVKYGWSEGHTLNYGWIALAIVIFGGWNPVRGSVGVYGFGILQVLSLKLQVNNHRFITDIAINSIPIDDFNTCFNSVSK